MGGIRDWAWLCEADIVTVTPRVTTGQAFVAGFVVGVVLAMVALIVGWAVSA